MRTTRWALMLGAVVAFVLTACGGSSTAVVADGGELVIELSEYQFSPSEIQVTAGSTVTFVVRNTGATAHEFMIGRRVRTVDGDLDGFEQDFFAGMEPVVTPADAVVSMEDMGEGMGDMGHGFMILRAKGEEARITFTVPSDAAGEWSIGCFREDGAHWTKGMQGTLTVVEG